MECLPSNKPVSSQRKADVLMCEKLCKNEPANNTHELEIDSKYAAACSDEKRSRTDRRQRREKRPDVQLYVPKPKQQPQHDLDGSSATTAVSLKSSDHKAEAQSESASDQKRGNAQSCTSDAASLPQPSTKSVPSTGRTFENNDLITQSQRFMSEPTSEHCSLESGKSSLSLPCSSGDLLSSGSHTADREESGDPVHSRVKQKMSKPLKSRNSEPKQEMSEFVDLSSALKNVDGDKRGKPPGNDIRSEELDWDFDGEFEYNHDGVSWGDLPPPSDHEWSDEDSHDSFAVPVQSAANSRKQKPRKQRANRRKRRQQTETSECVDVDEKLTGSSSSKSSNAALTDGSRSTKMEHMVITNRQFTDVHESAVRDYKKLNKNRDIADDSHCLENTRMENHSQLHHRQKETAEKPRSTVKNEPERKTGSKERQQMDKNSLQSSSDKQQSIPNMRENGRGENTQQPGSGRIGGIIRLPVGTITTASHDVTPSNQPQAPTSMRGRNRRSAHGKAGRRAMWSSDALESSAQQPHLGYDPAQRHVVYPAVGYYQRQSASPSSQLYYADYPPLNGASPTTPADSYIYGYSALAYDGLGYVDDNYYN